MRTWLGTAMACDRLGNLGVLALHGFDIPLNVKRICSTFRSKHPRRMCSPLVLMTVTEKALCIPYNFMVYVKIQYSSIMATTTGPGTSYGSHNRSPDLLRWGTNYIERDRYQFLRLSRVTFAIVCIASWLWNLLSVCRDLVYVVQCNSILEVQYAIVSN